MTKKERKTILACINELMDGDFSRGIAQLCRAVGCRYPAGELSVEGTTIDKLVKRDSKFKVRLR